MSTPCYSPPPDALSNSSGGRCWSLRSTWCAPLSPFLVGPSPDLGVELIDVDHLLPVVERLHLSLKLSDRLLWRESYPEEDEAPHDQEEKRENDVDENRWAPSTGRPASSLISKAFEHCDLSATAGTAKLLILFKRLYRKRWFVL